MTKWLTLFVVRLCICIILVLTIVWLLMLDNCMLDFENILSFVTKWLTIVLFHSYPKNKCLVMLEKMYGTMYVIKKQLFKVFRN